MTHSTEDQQLSHLLWLTWDWFVVGWMISYVENNFFFKVYFCVFNECITEPLESLYRYMCWCTGWGFFGSEWSHIIDTGGNYKPTAVTAVQNYLNLLQLSDFHNIWVQFCDMQAFNMHSKHDGSQSALCHIAVIMFLCQLHNCILLLLCLSDCCLILTRD